MSVGADRHQADLPGTHAGPPDDLVVEHTFIAGQAAILHAVATGAPLTDVLELITTTIEEQSDGMLASVLILEDGTLRHGSAPSLHPEYVTAIDGIAIGPSAGSCGTAAHDGRLVVVDDVMVDDKWEPFRHLAELYGFRACWSAPVVASDHEVLGTFALYYDRPRQPTSDELRLIDGAASLTAIALERDRDRRALERSVARFRSVFRSSPIGMALVDSDGRILEANETLGTSLGRSVDEMGGVRFDTLLHVEDGALSERLTSAIRGLHAPALEIENAGDGRVFEATFSHVTDPADVAADRCIVALQDITERRQLERLRAREAERTLTATHAEALAGLAQSAIVINSKRSVEEMLGSITEQACEIIGAKLGSTSLTVPGTGEAEGWPQLGISVHLADEYAAWREYDAPSRGAPSYGLVCADNDVVRLTDEQLKAHPLWSNFAQEEGRHPPMRGWLAAPLVASDGSNLGMLQLSDKVDGDFTEADESVVVQLAQMASVAVEKAQLQEAAEAQRRAKLREELLSGLSHDMQTPLATIVGLIDVLGEDLPLEDPEHRTAFDALARQTDHLYVLIQQFLDHLRLQADRELRIVRRAVDPGPVLDRVAGLFAHQREVIVTTTDGPLEIVADPVRLQQVLTNLVANAVKFSDDPVEIGVEATGDRVHIHVDDRGVGLPNTENPDVVFERFYRGPDAQGSPGTGLGLYVTREVVQAMGGAIVACDRDGGGARFTVSLPAAGPTR